MWFVIWLSLIWQVPGGNAADPHAAPEAAAAQQLGDPAAEGLNPAQLHEAGNNRDGAELDDDEEEDEEEDDDDEEGREEGAADVNNGGQGQCYR